jgi:hypothetical protein
MPPAVAYYRVSTERQRRSGLGIEAQQAAVARFADTAGFTLIAEFVEAGSGKGADALERRPQLARALATARSQRCPVIVAKLDRLSRDVAFIANLMAQRSSSPSLGVDADPNRWRRPHLRGRLSRAGSEGQRSQERRRGRQRPSSRETAPGWQGRGCSMDVRLTVASRMWWAPGG